MAKYYEPEYYEDDREAKTDALFGIASGLEAIAVAIQRLGLGDCTEGRQFGATEVLAREVRDGLNGIANCIAETKGMV